MTVRNNESRMRFEIPLDGTFAVLDYALQDGTVIVTHTEVPPALRGRGLAEILVRAALAWIDGRGLKIESRCGYVSRFIGKHPEFQHLVAGSFGQDAPSNQVPST